MIIRATPADVGSIVNLHSESLQDGLLYQLGRKVLTLFYRTIIKDEECFVFIFLENKRILGVAASSENSSKTFREVKRKYFITIVFSLLKAMLTDVFLLFRLISTGKYPYFPKEELMMLYVDQKKRSQGIGIQLLNATVEEYRKRKIKSFKITLLKKNFKGIKFYERYGFKKLTEFNYLKEKRIAYIFGIDTHNIP